MDYITKIEALNAELDILSLVLGSGIGLLSGLLLLFIVIIRIKGQKTKWLTENKYYQTSLQGRDEEIANLREKLSRSSEDVVRFQVQQESTEKQLKEYRENTTALELKFENLANKIFDEKTTKFKTQSQESLNVLLSPFKEKLNDFQKKVDESFSTQKAEQFSLKEQINLFIEKSDQMKTQTENLTSALKGDNKIQGNWGEIILEKILEEAGLRKDRDYVVQGVGLGIKHVETGGHLQPDVIVYLPEKKHIIIDSKVSLKAYESYCSIDDPTEKQQQLKKFITSVKDKVKELEERRYQDTDHGTPDFVVMFMPVEGAYTLALQSDTELHQFAWDKGVVLSGPSTLYSTLRTVASLWRLSDQNKHARDIVDHGNKLYDKIVGFVDDMKKMGANLNTLETNYNKAMNKLSDGKGSILNRTENMKSLGLTTSKTLPSELLDQENDLIAPTNNNEDKAA